MKYGSIPGVDKPISRVIQGTIMCSTEEQTFSNELLDDVYAQGINTLDTAHSYGNGESERSLGEWIQSHNLREEIVILTKGAHPSQDRIRVTPYEIRADIYDSLARLKTDYIDLYLLHRDNPELEVGPIVERLHEHREAGHIRAYGGSNWSHDRLAEVNAYAAAHGLHPFVASSPNLSLAYQAKDPWEGCISVSGPPGTEARKWYAENKMPLMAWSSLAGGFFSDRFRPDNLDTFDEYLDVLCVEVYCFGENWQRLERAKELANQKQVSLAQIALAFVLSQPGLDTYAISAAYNAREVQENVKVTEIELSADELNWLEGADND